MSYHIIYEAQGPAHVEHLPAARHGEGGLQVTQLYVGSVCYGDGMSDHNKFKQTTALLSGRFDPHSP